MTATHPTNPFRWHRVSRGFGRAPRLVLASSHSAARLLLRTLVTA